jgi:hypothetical protein
MNGRLSGAYGAESPISGVVNLYVVFIVKLLNLIQGRALPVSLCVFLVLEDKRKHADRQRFDVGLSRSRGGDLHIEGASHDLLDRFHIRGKSVCRIDGDLYLAHRQFFHDLFEKLGCVMYDLVCWYEVSKFQLDLWSGFVLFLFLFVFPKGRSSHEAKSNQKAEKYSRDTFHSRLLSDEENPSVES